MPGSAIQFIARKYGERSKPSHGGNERHPYAHRRERSRASGGAVSRFSRIMVFVAPSVARVSGSWIPCDRARYARLRADRSPSGSRSVHAAPFYWRRGRPARCFRHRDSGDRRTRLGRSRRVVRRAFAARSLSRRNRFERAVQTATTRSSHQHHAPIRSFIEALKRSTATPALFTYASRKLADKPGVADAMVGNKNCTAENLVGIAPTLSASSLKISARRSRPHH